ncbi:hypothetical protein LUZ61_006266 [Rhynchospora tenuis]|uniref:Hexosyltransferase n=1 Tax=Rhynchospora tenuis TaxID=198213 RepID=A0AAD5ZRA7_9POAL|nr:hypothetical protein LUZ61_006266 [Rhynchospora tenuis]
MIGVTREMLKATSSRSLVIKINIAFLALLLISYLVLLLRPSSLFDRNNNATTASLVRCTLHDCHLRKVARIFPNKVTSEKLIVKEKAPSFLEFMQNHVKVGLVNIEEDDLRQWGIKGQVRTIQFEPVSSNLEWKDLFPEWIDEEEDSEGSNCPEIPMPDVTLYDEVDVVVARLPCKKPEEGWNRDVFRLQVHMVSAKIATRKGKMSQNGTVKVIFLSKCEPMMDIFRCDDLVEQEGEWWMYEAKVDRLEEKLRLPMGSCNLALPLWDEGVNNEFNTSKLTAPLVPAQREAYATVLHSSVTYLCGAIILAQSIRRSGSTRDLLLLHDKSIPQDKLDALAAAGWTLRLIKRIRNPKAEPGTYNEHNYSKFRLWQLTDYDKIIFVDSDVVVLRSLDILFSFPQMSAAGNDGSIFNSGVMVIEPSNCTFKTLMRHREDVVSYNGGDQGFLNELFVWWHRMPRRVNYLKNFWANTTGERMMKEHLITVEPPKLYSIHYLGLKPWLCYRDYDCNWDIDDQRVYASDVANQRWWKLHDEMDQSLQFHCRLSERRKIELLWDRKMAGKAGFPDEHWRINVTDPRKDL